MEQGSGPPQSADSSQAQREQRAQVKSNLVLQLTAPMVVAVRVIKAL